MRLENINHVKHINRFVKYTKLVALLFVCCGLSNSCKKYLSIKPDKVSFIPSTLDDLQNILNDDRHINEFCYPWHSELAADNYYLSYTDWASMYSLSERNTYIWNDDGNDAVGGFAGGTTLVQWDNCYLIVLYANTVLDNIKNISITSVNKADWNRVKGEALFFRGYAFYHVAELWSKPYNLATASTDLGIPLRLNSSIDEVSVRSTLEQTYHQIISDLTEAASLLPVTSLYPTLPNKPAAFGALARVCLFMRDYVHAGLFSDTCLQLYNSLLDYNSLNTAAAYPIATFNKEVIFHNTTYSSLFVGLGKIDSLLYQSYAVNDRRKGIFFKNNGDNTYSFKGTYDGTIGPTGLGCFNGIATDEMYLVRAECAAHAGDKDSAMNDLNRLLIKRFAPPFTAFTATTAADALDQVLTERRKELLFRGLRWSDLRRFNLEGANITLKRILNGQTYTLAPNDPRWIIPIPQTVINFTGIQQNPR